MSTIPFRRWNILERPNLPHYCGRRFVFMVQLPRDHVVAFNEYVEIMATFPGHTFLLSVLDPYELVNSSSGIKLPLNVIPTLTVMNSANLLKKERPFKELLGDRVCGLHILNDTGDTFDLRCNWDFIVLTGVSMNQLRMRHKTTLFDASRRTGSLPAKLLDDSVIEPSTFLWEFEHA